MIRGIVSLLKISRAVSQERPIPLRCPLGRQLLLGVVLEQLCSHQGSTEVQ